MLSELEFQAIHLTHTHHHLLLLLRTSFSNQLGGSQNLHRRSTFLEQGLCSCHQPALSEDRGAHQHRWHSSAANKPGEICGEGSLSLFPCPDGYRTGNPTRNGQMTLYKWISSENAQVSKPKSAAAEGSFLSLVYVGQRSEQQ